MNPAYEPGVINAVGSGLPLLLASFVLTLLLLAAGVRVYAAVTPIKEWTLVRQGNVAAAVTLAGAVLALAIPLTALLATSFALLDILVWGIVALLIQLLVLALVSHLLRDMRHMIEAGNVAAAVILAASQVAVALLNAAAMVPS
jgi:putative membrane protein